MVRPQPLQRPRPALDLPQFKAPGPIPTYIIARRPRADRIQFGAGFCVGVLLGQVVIFTALGMCPRPQLQPQHTPPASRPLGTGPIALIR
jgi:hypothetical protein